MNNLVKILATLGLIVAIALILKGVFGIGELGGKKLSKIKKQQELDKKKVITESIEGIGLMDKVKRLKKLYINGTLTKAEFEKAKDKLLK
jgi:hypothetical protein